MTIDYELLGERIQEIRISKGLKQMALAHKANLSLSYMSQVENGNKRIRLQPLLQIAEALDVTADTLLVGNQKEHKKYCDSDFDAIISDCNQYEKNFICGIAREAKKLLRENDLLKK